MERDFTSSGCSFRALLVMIAVIILYALSYTEIFEKISIVFAIGLIAIISFVFIRDMIFGAKWREKARKNMGTQYERSPQRLELCKKVFDAETEITTFDDLDFVKLVSDDGYIIEWRYTQDWERFSIEMLIHEWSFSIVKALFQKMVESFQDEFGNEMCKGFTYNLSDSKEKYSYLIYIEGLTHVDFVLELSKDINMGKLEQVLRGINVFARNTKDKFSHRQFDVDYNGRYYLAYRGLVLESVSKKKWKNIEPVDRNEFLSEYGNTEIRTLTNAIDKLIYGEDNYINRFKDV